MGIKSWWRGLFSLTDEVGTSYQPVRLSRSLMMGRGPFGSVSRERALEIPGILRGRNLICSISTLPLEAVNPQNRVVDHPLLRQIDPNVSNLVTLAQTVEDLLFEGIAWWRITDFAWMEPGWVVPAAAIRYAPNMVSLTEPGMPDARQPGYLPSGAPRTGVVWMDGEEVPWGQVIRFDSPNPPLLEVARSTINRASLIDGAAEMYADSPRPMDYFTPAADTDPVDDDQVEEIMDAWRMARKERGTAYVPAALKYNEVQQPTPADLQLVQLQKQVTQDVANALGLDPEDLGISTTTRTYQNSTDRRKDRINDVLAPYMSAITSRLNMLDVTPDGVRVRFGLDDYLKADPKTRAEVQQIYVNMGALGVDEVRESEGLPPRATPALRPAVPPALPVAPASDIPEELTA